MRTILKSDFHFIWIILFFIINGYNRHIHSIKFSELFFLFLLLTGISGTAFWLAFMFFRSKKKAGVFTSLSLVIVLFFGVFQDTLADVKALAAISSLTRFLLVVFGFFVLFILWLRSTKESFIKTAAFLNVLFLVYVILECIILMQGIIGNGKNKKFSSEETSCNTCSRPDVYLIVLDEYFGFTGLREYFKFDNSVFAQALEEKGFKVLSDTRSNYALTIYSMASMLNMEFLKNIKATTLTDAYSYKTALSRIESNIVIEKFKGLGYDIHNRSRFNIHDAPSDYATGLLPSRIQLINSKTMYYRIGKHLPYFLAKKGFDWFAERIHNRVILKNQQMMSETLQKAGEADSIPTFTYMHLLMPHEPYAFDSTGRAIVPFWRRNSYSASDIDQAYLQYLVYTSKQINNYVGELLKATKGDAVILLMSDHGYRNAALNGYKDICHVVNAVYLPGKSKAGWYNGMTNVNQFRVLFNSLFNERLPMLKDSVIQ
jgi:hypothetical protein